MRFEIVGTAALALLVGAPGCTFDLAEVDASSSSGDAGIPVADAYVDTPVDTPADTDGGQDGNAPDVTEDVTLIDGCWPPSDAAFCNSHSFVCGTLEATDACGQARSVVCGACGADTHCEQGVCLDYVYTWRTGDWSNCSASCDGGTQTRTVWCERDDSTMVDDSKCSGTKPPVSTSCNTQACYPPTGPVIVDPPLVSDTQIGLSWQPVAGATEYFVLWSSALGDGAETVTTTWIIIDTDTSYDHWVSIYPCNSAGCGDPAQFGPISK